MFFQPKTLKEYKSLLTEKSSSEKFKLKKNEIRFCKRVIFLIQCCVNFGDDVSSFHVFKSDPKSLFVDLFKNVKIKVKKNYNYLNNLGFAIGTRSSQSINKKYLKFIINKK